MSATSVRSRRTWIFVQLGIGLAIGALALLWAARGLNLRQVLDVLTNARYVWVLSAFACVVGVALTKTMRWSALYITTARVSFVDLFSALMITQMINVVIPIRVGELVRIGLMKQSHQPGAATLATIAIEKSVDLVAAGIIALLLVVFAVAPAWIQQWAGSVLVLGFALVAGLVLVWWWREWLARIVERVLALGGFLPARWRERLLRIARTMLQSFGALADTHALALVAFWTALAWILSLLTVLMLFLAFDFPLPVAAALVLMLALNFSNIVPAPPALVGIMQAIAVVVLGEYGISQTTALGFGIILNVVTVAPLILLGCFGLWRRALWSFEAARRLLARVRGMER